MAPRPGTYTKSDKGNNSDEGVASSCQVRDTRYSSVFMMCLMSWGDRLFLRGDRTYSV